MLPGDQPVELASHHEDRTGDVLGDALERQVGGARIGLVLRGAVAAHAERLAGQFGKTRPCLPPVIRAAERNAGLQTLFESRRARRVIAAETDAPQTDA